MMSMAQQSNKKTKVYVADATFEEEKIVLHDNYLGEIPNTEREVATTKEEISE